MTPLQVIAAVFLAFMVSGSFLAFLVGLIRAGNRGWRG